MRLLNTTTLQLKSFFPHEIPDYVILSHQWGLQEVVLKDVISYPMSDLNSPTRQLAGFSKLEGTCKLAATHGYEWVWIDTCCIDKESSADLDKSINSMWNYYTKANICYAYMVDVKDCVAGRGMAFGASEWFSRGWTLQELIAPIYVEFYAADWSFIGTKMERHKEIEEITTIPSDLLTQNKSIEIYTTAERFSWAAHRQVTQEEDEAYSLLGLFQIQMPMLYGEGRVRAFARLQEVIYLSRCDDSIFLFRYSPHIDGSQPLLADCSTRFCQKVQCTPCQRELGGTECFPAEVPYAIIAPSSVWTTQPHEQIITTVTPFRNDMSVPLALVEYTEVHSKLITYGSGEDHTEVSHVAVLNHTIRDHPDGAFCLLLHGSPDSGAACYYRVSTFPAFLPNIGDYATRMQKTKIVIPGPVLGDKLHKIETIFRVTGDSHRSRAWNAKFVDTVQRLHERLDDEFETHELKILTGSREFKENAQVSCRIADHRYPNTYPHISLQMEKVVDTWSIGEVFEVNHKGQHKRHLFTPEYPADRCTITFSNGTQLYIGLRRCAAAAQPQNAQPITQQYQIIVQQASDVVL